MGADPVQAFSDGIEEYPENEQGGICGRYCNKCIRLKICIYKDIFRITAS